mmetsp:Transcript_56499/g.123823  ORF Transcript_56499/g.123823 Transcript_56499/m.123823 type:complete len:851 (+) Transcript_56499:48-2600(+)|eukprot:CAMPEP_0204257898 /NCGR_PEP_ID=MMETSP0468-20130131/4701_1 /ASSEMBLY_ACC=CAM_ASM_000383 /TAXON_ID=2969 /ORGANISM="Oxyrrhis marina" /LENGTH=850 /DNA_ID=CAMNT_0051232071 /DNA_START=1 /DNA_END=2553 /DNA_ORIENTATION=-
MTDNGTTAAPVAELEAKMCELGGSGLLLPLFGDAEQEWATGLRVVLYLAGLAWCFMGVAIVADVFMSAIEAITSKTKSITVQIEETGETRKVRIRVWNDTVANLTLMALGSSAPEILLSVIELMSNKFYSGALGPSTIVGSAAFNLMGITAICVIALPPGENRVIKGMAVFGTTAVASVFAYLWLLVILVVISEDRVEIWEGVLTFLFFPMLVIFSFAADKQIFGFTKQSAAHLLSAVTTDAGHKLDRWTAHKIRGMLSAVTKKNAAGVITISEKLLETISVPVVKSRAYYRMAATRSMFRRGGMTSNQVQKAEGFDDSAEEPLPPDCVLVGFSESNYQVMENAGKVVLTVTRDKAEQEMKIDWQAVDGPNAVLGVAYTVDGTTVEAGVATNGPAPSRGGQLEFQAGEFEKSIPIQIIDDAQFNEDKVFSVELSNVVTTAPSYRMGKKRIASVTILNDDLPGELSFEQDFWHITSDNKKVVVNVVRKKGFAGTVTTKYQTIDGKEGRTAHKDRDYVHCEGTLTFEHGCTSMSFVVQLPESRQQQGREVFHVQLLEPTGGAEFPKMYGEIVEADVIIDDQLGKSALPVGLAFNHDFHAVAAASYKEQFIQAWYINGSPEGNAEAGVLDRVIHYINLPWKLIFATIAPPLYAGGWLCFCMSLAYIGAVTALVGDLAGLVGCVMDIPDEITAITLVALGTSLPDTFASMTAARQDDTADNCVGNVTGSNSVNVFLGLGLPWSIGAIYWSLGFEGEKKAGWLAKLVSSDDPSSTYESRYCMNGCSEGSFIVPAGSLGVSVATFSGCATATLLTLVFRRAMGWGELGGPRKPALATACFFGLLWVVYITVSILNT